MNYTELLPFFLALEILEVHLQMYSKLTQPFQANLVPAVLILFYDLALLRNSSCAHQFQ